MTLGLHHAQLMLHAQQRAEDVGIEDGRVALGGMFYNRTGLAFGSGSVYRHIKATEACHGLIDEVSYVVLVPYIRIHEFRLRVESAQLSHQISADFITSTSDNDALAPSFAKARAAARPMPERAPVIKTTGV
jgi:hypothetical protein